MSTVDARKQKEAEFHDVIRDEALQERDEKKFKKLTANRKFYSITRQSDDFVHQWIFEKGKDKKLLDYCCGNGGRSILFAKNGMYAVGIDISSTSIENAEREAVKQGVASHTEFLVMDAEATKFKDNTFDVAACIGVLHHLDTEKAFKELARITKPEGQVICNEPIAYNPLFQLYRKLTPQLRTEWEMHHILSKRDIEKAKTCFGKVEMRFFHLATLGAVPFHNTPLFKPVLKLAEAVDSILLRIPLVQWLSWQIVFILSEPKKQVYDSKESF
ncbi:class I SAM-dependent methyltransferase [Patescibacteria group bacterium]|nr:class I SAM-dependent methyltransferase [Patescibacteria group bacterium]